MEKNFPLQNYLNSIDSDFSLFCDIISQHKKAENLIYALLPCDFIPFEILRAFGIQACVMTKELEPILQKEPFADVIIAPQHCYRAILNSRIKKINIQSIPQEYGETSIPLWKEFIFNIIAQIKNESVDSPQLEKLHQSSTMYSTLRRLVRGITFLRKDKPALLSNQQLKKIFSHALAMPPEHSISKLSMILENLNEIRVERTSNAISALVFAPFNFDWIIFDELEKLGFILVEDDSCCGRRSFDLSYNCDSESLLGEIIYTFSFKSMCPCLRNISDRFELLYKMLAPFEIETAILFTDEICKARAHHIEFMRPKLMRMGIDPLVLNFQSFKEDARKYIEYALR